MRNPAIGKIMNPIGTIAPSKGPLQTLDPVQMIARKQDGPMRGLIDPTLAMREMDETEESSQQTSLAPKSSLSPNDNKRINRNGTDF